MSPGMHQKHMEMMQQHPQTHDGKTHPEKKPNDETNIYAGEV